MCLEHIPLQFYLSLFLYTLLHTILLLLGPHLFLFFKTYWVQLLLPVAMLTHLADLIMCRSCPGNHSCSGFIRATTAMCSPKESISEHHFDLLLFCSFWPSSIMSRALCWQADMCSPRAEHSTARNLSSLTIYESLHCCPLKKEASLASAKNTANLRQVGVVHLAKQ